MKQVWNLKWVALLVYKCLCERFTMLRVEANAAAKIEATVEVVQILKEAFVSLKGKKPLNKDEVNSYEKTRNSLHAR